MNAPPSTPAAGAGHDERLAGVILDTLPAHVALLDPAGMVLAVNGSWRSFATTNALQYSDLDVGQNYVDICASATGDGSEEAKAAAIGIRRVLHGEAKDFSIEYPCHSPAEQRWFLLTARPVREDGCVGAVVMHVDITERKQAGEALRTSEERFRLLAKATLDAAWDWDLVTSALAWNEGFEILFGYRREDVDPTIESWTDCIHPDDLVRVTNGIHHVVEHGGESWSDEYRFRRHDGEYAYVLDRGHIIRDAADRAVRMVGAMTDLTERRRSETALRESNEKFHLLADHLTDAFWIRSPDMRELHYVSPAFEQIWGCSTESLYADPQQWSDFVLEEDRERVRDAFATLVGDAPRLDIEYRIARPDGGIRWIRVRGFQVRDAAGSLVRLTGIVTDITERKLVDLEISRMNQALQIEIVERKRAEDAAGSANRAKSEFLANMSHEIRTPLNGVMGMTALALGTDLTTEQREYLDMARSSGELLLTVIDDILDFSKIEAGKLGIDLIPFDLHDCLAITLRQLATRAHVKGLELACDIRPDVPIGVVSDPSRLRQIVTNLLSNAIKFTEHGEVVLTVEAETCTSDDVILRFSVSDTGIGGRRYSGSGACGSSSSTTTTSIGGSWRQRSRGGI